MTETGLEVDEDITPRIACSLCGRKFLPERLERHTIVCNKTKQYEKKRRIFDSHKQRADLEEVNGFPISLSTPSKSSTTQSKPNKTQNWRQKHEEFLRTVRQARGEKVSDDINEDNKPRVPVGYIECNTCGRNFSDKAADRHMAFCKEQKARIPRSAKVVDKAMVRMKARTKYKPSNKASTKAESHPTQPQSPPDKQIMAKSVRPSPPNSINIRKTPPNTMLRKKKISPSPVRSDKQRINSLSRPKNSSPDTPESHSKPVEPVMKFKDKFPNHPIRYESKYIKNDQMRELLKKSEAYNGGPRTVPGVRTGGMSPIKNDNLVTVSQNGHYYNEPEDEELAQLKSRIEEMYLNGSTKFKPNSMQSSSNSPISNGMNGKKVMTETNSESTTRGSTSGSSDSSIQEMSRDGSSEGARSQGSNSTGLPKFCHQCGTKYPITIAKYCYECGSRRLGTVGPFLA